VADDLIGVSYFADVPEQVFLDRPGRSSGTTSCRATRPHGHAHQRVARRAAHGVPRRIEQRSGTYFLYDRDTKKFEELARAMAWLDPARLAPMQPIGCRPGMDCGCTAT